MSSLINGVKITTTKTAKIEGTGDLLVIQLKEFVECIPDSAKIDIKGADNRHYPGEYGIDSWALTATWNE